MRVLTIVNFVEKNVHTFGSNYTFFNYFGIISILSFSVSNNKFFL